MSRAPALRFGDFEWVGPEQRLLQAGERVELGHRAFALLGLLASRAGQVVSKHEAFAQVWPGRVVEENNLQVQVSALRKLLGREAIATVPGQGYRFTWVVHSDQPADLAARMPVRSAPMLLGRDHDLASLAAWLSKHPMVTVVGEGGIGKTSLARALLAQSPAWAAAPWVDLSVLSHVEQLPHALATAMGLHLPPGADEVESLLAQWPMTPVRLVLDNCEHLAAGVAHLLARLFEARPDVQVLATSQTRLNLSAEQVYRLAPLALPLGSDLNAAQSSPAVQLLARGIQRGRQGFVITAEQAPALCELCRQLDGMALAIELAAAQVVRLGLPAVIERLGDRLRLLSGGSLDRPERQRTLRATMAWSHALLTPVEQTVFWRLGVFAGGFELPAALAVVCTPELDAWSATEALATLLERNLVITLPATREDGRLRYGLLESARAYALELCEAAGERHAVGERHARWMHDLFEQAFEQLGTRSDTGWRSEFGPELDNLRLALHFCLHERAAPDLGIGLAGWSADLWPILSLLSEGRRHLDAAHACLQPDTPPRHAAAMWDGLGYLWQDADPRRALAARQEAELQWRRVDDRRWVRSVLGQAWNQLYLDQLADAESALAQTAPAVEAHPHLKALHRTTLGALRQRQERLAEALQAYEDALTLRRRQGDARRTLIMLLNMGDLACAAGQLNAALDWGRQAEAEARRQQDQALLGVILGNLCSALWQSQATAEAEACAREAVPLLQQTDGLAYLMDSLAALACQQHRPFEAACLLGHADAALAQRGVVRQAAEARWMATLRQRLEQALGPAQCRACEAEGAHWQTAQALACALP